jgi:YD repeat-containing protein
MFDAAGSKRPEYWQVMRVDAVTQDRLKGVIMNRYDAEGRLVESVEAREAFVWVERDQRRVMLELRQGESVVEGRRKPLADGKFQTVLGEGEAISQVFAASGLRLIGSR